ncbi:hypothetical protein T492DRAFT_1015741 [Pavlovales sp. CCMP2436]|nr:hypothetical protein T492DRAFT_1015741 [Pavlovales sp. CCMP2436]
MQCVRFVRAPGRMHQECVDRLMTEWDMLDPKTRSMSKIKTTSLVDSVPGVRDFLNKQTDRHNSSELARAGGSHEALCAENVARERNHRSTGRPAERQAVEVARGIRAADDKAYYDREGGARKRERRLLEGNARRAAVTAVTVRKFDVAAPVPFFLGGPDSSSFFKDSHELVALVRAYAGYTKPASASSSVASEGDDDLDDEESPEPEGESGHLPE